eukprot:CAMPEP_0171928244 /NCGR_PEP_ID=MMETSP0993-20121228/26595_1 /TAXON_ID=483369 /ORGANISM="non described non described, Strain CCMP2098" /LENGTH=102 /DNA_ID=CAMNT_0012567515 /DNA_START=21 /DNA_END=325 /DNA_ORIENTATION=-
MVLEVLLGEEYSDKTLMEKDREFGLLLRTEVVTAFSVTDVTSPLEHGGRGSISNANLVAFTRETQRYFCKRAAITTNSFIAAVTTRREAHAAILQESCVTPP